MLQFLGHAVKYQQLFYDKSYNDQLMFGWLDLESNGNI